MAFPEFESKTNRVLFFSRGRGRGHAIPDIAIFRALQELRSDVEVRFVSYGTGARTFDEAGISLIDLGLPDFGGIVDTSVLAGKLIGWLNPDLVVSHEEFPALPSAKIFDKPTVLITDWFVEAEGYATSSLKYADQILFLGQSGVFNEPPWIRDRVRYLGAFLRPLAWGPVDRLRARADLGIAEGDLVVSVFPGSWAEAQTPLVAAVLEAFELLDAPGKRLFWVAGPDCDAVQAALADCPEAEVTGFCPEMERLMVASDVAVTKSNRKTVFELQYLGVPTIAVSYGLNAGDELAIAPLRNVSRVSAQDLNGTGLRRTMQELLTAARVEQEIAFCSATECAEWILRSL